jgi:hypothetical protein
VQVAATRTGPSSSAPAAPAPDPLDDAVYVFPPVCADPYPYARFAGHLPALRLPAPRPSGLGTRVTARHALVVWSIVDLWAFVAALRLGPGPLAPVALAGLIATCWHLRVSSRRRRPATRTTSAMIPSLTAWDPLGAATSRPWLHTTYVPRRLRRRRPLIGTRRPSDWWPRPLSPAVLMAGSSVVAGAVVHVALSGAGPLH